MKAYGYVKKKIDRNGLLEMREITFTGSPSAIREIARFLMLAAEQMEARGGQFHHAHIKAVYKDWLEKWPDIIVARSGS